MNPKRLLFLVSFCLIVQGLIASENYGPDAPLGNAAGLQTWFKSLAQELVISLSQSQEFLETAGKVIDIKKLQDALKTPVMVVDQNDPIELKNIYGEMKDGKVIFYSPTRPVIYFNRYTWTNFFETNQPEFRTILHLYLYAAGYDDVHYAYSSMVPESAFPKASPDEDRSERSFLWHPSFIQQSTTLRMDNGDYVVIRERNPAASFTYDHYREHPAYLQANSIERYSEKGRLRWIYFPNKFPVKKAYTMNQDYISFYILYLEKVSNDRIRAKGKANLDRYRYEFELMLNAQGELESVTADPNPENLK